MTRSSMRIESIVPALLETSRHARAIEDYSSIFMETLSLSTIARAADGCVYLSLRALLNYFLGRCCCDSLASFALILALTPVLSPARCAFHTNLLVQPGHHAPTRTLHHYALPTTDRLLRRNHCSAELNSPTPAVPLPTSP